MSVDYDRCWLVIVDGKLCRRVVVVVVVVKVVVVVARVPRFELLPCVFVAPLHPGCCCASCRGGSRGCRCGGCCSLDIVADVVRPSRLWAPYFPALV